MSDATGTLTPGTAIPFTQYMRPDGRQVPVSIQRPTEIAALAEKFIAAGGKYEIEHLTTGEASMTAVWDGDDVEIEVCENGPAVRDAVDRLVRKSQKHVVGN